MRTLPARLHSSAASQPSLFLHTDSKWRFFIDLNGVCYIFFFLLPVASKSLTETSRVNSWSRHSWNINQWIIWPQLYNVCTWTHLPVHETPPLGLVWLSAEVVLSRILPLLSLLPDSALGEGKILYYVPDSWSCLDSVHGFWKFLDSDQGYRKILDSAQSSCKILYFDSGPWKFPDSFF